MGRVLPAELVKNLIETGMWERLDFKKGPPKHRLDDMQGAPKEAEYYNHLHSDLVRDARKIKGMTNSAGRPVWLGENQFSLYCGAQFEKPKQIEHRLGHDVDAGQLHHDGKCGPSKGPQCASCRWLED